MSPSAAPATQSAAASQAPKPVQARHPVPCVPRLPRETKVNVTKCHACHVKRRWMSPSAAPATQSAAASQAPKPVQARHPVPCVPRLPRKTKVNVTKCHACHVKRRWMSPSATPATWNEGECHQVPRLPRKVPRRHRRPSQSKRATQCHVSHACHVKRRWMSRSATPATWNEGECHEVPRLPRKVSRRHRRPSQSKRATQCHVSHACHVKRRWMSRSATPATWNEGECHQVPRLPRKVPRRHRRPSQSKRATQCHVSHACHVKRRWMSRSATPATWNEGECHQVPRLPRKVPRRHRRPSQSKRATQCHVSHACHAKRQWMGVSATPASVCVSVCVCVCACVRAKCVWTKSVWTKSVLTKSVWTKSVCVKVYVDKMCVDKECVDKEEWSVCWQSVCVCQSVCWQKVCGQRRVKCMLTKCVCVKVYLTKCVLTKCVLSKSERGREAAEEEAEHGIQNP